MSNFQNVQIYIHRMLLFIKYKLQSLSSTKVFFCLPAGLANNALGHLMNENWRVLTHFHDFSKPRFCFTIPKQEENSTTHQNLIRKSAAASFNSGEFGVWERNRSFLEKREIITWKVTTFQLNSSALAMTNKITKNMICDMINDHWPRKIKRDSLSSAAVVCTRFDEVFQVFP